MITAKQAGVTDKLIGGLKKYIPAKAIASRGARPAKEVAEQLASRKNSLRSVIEGVRNAGKSADPSAATHVNMPRSLADTHVGTPKSLATGTATEVVTPKPLASGTSTTMLPSPKPGHEIGFDTAQMNKAMDNHPGIGDETAQFLKSFDNTDYKANRAVTEAIPAAAGPQAAMAAQAKSNPLMQKLFNRRNARIAGGTAVATGGALATGYPQAAVQWGSDLKDAGDKAIAVSKAVNTDDLIKNYNKVNDFVGSVDTQALGQTVAKANQIAKSVDPTKVTNGINQFSNYSDQIGKLFNGNPQAWGSLFKNPMVRTGLSALGSAGAGYMGAKAMGSKNPMIWSLISSLLGGGGAYAAQNPQIRGYLSKLMSSFGGQQQAPAAQTQATIPTSPAGSALQSAQLDPTQRLREAHQAGQAARASNPNMTPEQKQQYARKYLQQQRATTGSK